MILSNLSLFFINAFSITNVLSNSAITLVVFFLAESKKSNINHLRDPPPSFFVSNTCKIEVVHGVDSLIISSFRFSRANILNNESDSLANLILCISQI